MEDIFFDVIDTKTNNRVNRLGKNSTEITQFALLTTIAAGRTRVSLQLKPKGGKDRGEWTTITCQTMNLEVADISGVDVNANIKHDTRDFKDIEFELSENEEISLGKKEQYFTIKAGKSNLKWGTGFKPKIVFTHL